jgi:predicted membrane channel-forming protein YqfA (hemolysin III family)
MAVGPLNRSTTGCPPDFNWNYDRVEIIADGVVHSIGVGLGIVGAVFLHLAIPHFANNGQVTSVAIYAVGLLTALGLSAAYNLWPVSPAAPIRSFRHLCFDSGDLHSISRAQLKTGLAAVGLIVIWLTTLSAAILAAAIASIRAN